MRLAVALLAAGLAAPALAQDAVGARIGQSAAAAESLQGALDGAWILAGSHGQVLAYVQIDAPPTGGPLACAWRPPDGSPALAQCRRDRDRLILEFAGGKAVLRLTRSALWRGALKAGRTARTVVLRRG